MAAHGGQLHQGVAASTPGTVWSSGPTTHGVHPALIAQPPPGTMWSTSDGYNELMGGPPHVPPPHVHSTSLLTRVPPPPPKLPNILREEELRRQRAQEECGTRNHEAMMRLRAPDVPEDPWEDAPPPPPKPPSVPPPGTVFGLQCRAGSKPSQVAQPPPPPFPPPNRPSQPPPSARENWASWAKEAAERPPVQGCAPDPRHGCAPLTGPFDSMVGSTVSPYTVDWEEYWAVCHSAPDCAPQTVATPIASMPVRSDATPQGASSDEERVVPPLSPLEMQSSAALSDPYLGCEPLTQWATMSEVSSNWDPTDPISITPHSMSFSIS